MNLEHGTEDEHLGTLRRAKDNGLKEVWSGDLIRNSYLRENVAYAQEKGILSVELVEYREAQCSNYVLTWLKDDF